jgi:multidrug efflux system outer membrane protein
MSMPIIDGGRNKANIARSEAVLEESVATYRQNVLVAFAEVEDNLAGLRILAGQAEQVDGRGVGAPFGRPGAEAVPGRAVRATSTCLTPSATWRGRTQRGAAARQPAVTTVALIRSLGGGWGDANTQAVAQR